jgi:hypothetical protein
VDWPPSPTDEEAVDLETLAIGLVWPQMIDHADADGQIVTRRRNRGATIMKSIAYTADGTTSDHRSDHDRIERRTITKGGRWDLRTSLRRDPCREGDSDRLMGGSIAGERWKAKRPCTPRVSVQSSMEREARGDRSSAIDGRSGRNRGGDGWKSEGGGGLRWICSAPLDDEPIEHDSPSFGPPRIASPRCEAIAWDGLQVRDRLLAAAVAC